ncbi:response regulator transcription factor [Actinomadura sp. 6N118]|uniref:response regulator transcription factor n=1 Tax=Actinomadura sp. 6N118 TaxID=3375151 RepID=UPI00378B0074
MRVLVVEDEDYLAELIAEGLRSQAIATDVAHDGAEALRRFEAMDYDVVVLDRDLPEVHGDDVCRQIVDSGRLTRILMLTASGTVRDRVEGLGLGADDYLPKPFSYEELVARVLALGRRARPALPPVLKRAGVVLDIPRRQAYRDGRRLDLSRKEFAVLETLMRADGAVVGTDELIEEVWEEHISYNSNAVRVTVSKLRAKLGQPSVVETVSGSGYRMRANGDAGERMRASG